MAGAHTDISKHIKIYLLVFAVLALGTIITVFVGQDYVDMLLGR